MNACGLFVDVQNLYFCISRRFPGRKMNYEALVKLVSKKFQIYRSIAYGIQKESEAAYFISCLKYQGFETKFREPRPYSTWDVGLTLDVVRILEKIDTVVLCSSSRELFHLVDFIGAKGIRTEVIACGIPTDLRRKCNRYTEVNESLLQLQTETETVNNSQPVQL